MVSLKLIALSGAIMIAGVVPLSLSPIYDEASDIGLPPISASASRIDHTEATDVSQEYMVLSGQAGDKGPLFNRMVKNPKGERLGTIDRLIFDVRGGRIAYVVISLENGRLVPLPWSSFSVSHDDKVITLNATEEQLEKAVITSDVNEILGQ